MRESVLGAISGRVLQRLAMTLPGGGNLRVMLHRMRGVHVGEGVWIGGDALIESAHPGLVWIGDRVVIGLRTTILAHFQEVSGVRIEDDVYVGACALVLPGVTIGRGSVVAAGSVVTTSVPPATMVQGNPARRVARVGVPLGLRTSRADFVSGLKPYA
jgi:acetyltransferase-like isoleucine patch superfamily enzyme